MRRSTRKALSASWQGAASRPCGRWALRTSGLARIWIGQPCPLGHAPEECLRVFAFVGGLDSGARQKPKGPLRALADLSIRIVLVVVHIQNDFHGYSAATMACLAHARHSDNVQRQARPGCLRVQTTVVVRGWRFSSSSTRRLNTPVTPTRLVRSLASRSPGRGLIRGLRMIVLDGAGLALANGEQDAGTEPVHDASMEVVAMVLRREFGVRVAVVELCPSATASAGVGFDEINLRFHGWSQTGQQRREFARNLRADFDLQLHGLTVGLSRETELAFAVDGKRARFTRPLIALDSLAEWRGDLGQRRDALGAVVVVLRLGGGAGSRLALVFGQQPAPDIRRDPPRILGFRHVHAGLGGFALAVIGPVLTQAVCHAGGYV